MRSITRTLSALAAVSVLVPAEVVSAGDLLVFAAASLKESLTEAADVYAAGGEQKPVIAFAASSALAKQIENGAPAGLFISADEQWMDYLTARELIVPGTRTPLLGNQLVLVAPASRPFEIPIGFGFGLAGVLGEDKLAMADPDSVPAGRYGKSALTNLGVWRSIEGNVARAADVRAALALVERDEARAGIVYRTDALATKSVVVAGTFPDTSHQPIVYSVGIVAGHSDAETRRMYDFLISNAAEAVFEKYGFSTK